MNAKFRYILVALIVILIYEVYIVIRNEYNQYQTNNYVSSLEKINKEIEARNEYKRSLTLYVRTPAYQSYVAKATQNKKLPGEEVTNIISEDTLTQNTTMDVNSVISTVKAEARSPTRNMKNPEKWHYILENLREYL
jgi:hypothetical protein